MSEILSIIRALLGITGSDQDVLLMHLWNIVFNEIQTITHRTYTAYFADDAQLKFLACTMVVYRYNRLGTEGVTSEDYSGVTFDYTETYPPEILNQLKAYRKVRVI